MMNTMDIKRQKDNEHLAAVKKNVHSERTLRKYTAGKGMDASRTVSGSPSKRSITDKLKAVQEEAKKKLDEKRAVMNEKMVAFDERMKKKEEYDKMSAEEKKELARQWAETLQMNVRKKKLKETYKRESLEEKLKQQQEKQKVLEEHQKILKKERFYAKITNEMKAHYVKEALHDMALKKDWSLDRIDNIMETFQPVLQEGPEKDEKAIENNINKVLKDPFYQISNLCVKVNNRRVE